MSEAKYWYGVDGQRLGPVSLEEIHAMAREGRLRPTDYIWNEQHQVWTRVTDFLGATGGASAKSAPPDSSPEFSGENAAPDQDAEFEAHAAPNDGADWGAEAGQRYGGAWVNPNAGMGQADTWAEPREYAGFWLRVGAHIIDGFVMGAIGMVWFFIAMGLGLLGDFMALESTGDPGDMTELWDAFPVAYYVVSFLISWIYEAAFVASRWMATPGKRAMGIVVVNEQGQQCGFGQASLRFLMKNIFAAFTFGLAYLVVAFTEKKQGMHDFIAQTFCEKT